MFGLEYILAFMGVAFQVAFAVVSAVVFRLAWNSIAPIYLSFLPEIYHNIPYWKFVGIILTFTFIGEQIQKITPKFVSVDQTNKEK